MQETPSSKAGYALITDSAFFSELLMAARGSQFDTQSLNNKIITLRATIAAEPNNKHAATILRSLEEKAAQGKEAATQQLFTINLKSIDPVYKMPEHSTVYGALEKDSNEIVFKQPFSTRLRGGTMYLEDMAIHDYWIGLENRQLRNEEYRCQHLPIDPNLADKNIKFELSPQVLIVQPELGAKFHRAQNYTVLTLVPEQPKSTPIMAVFMLEGEKMGNIDPNNLPQYLKDKVVCMPVDNVENQQPRIHAITSQFLNFHLR